MELIFCHILVFCLLFYRDLINAQAFMTNFSSKVRSHVFMIDGQFNLRVPMYVKLANE